MRVLQVLTTKIRTGIGTHVLAISRGLQERGIDVLLAPLAENDFAQQARDIGLPVSSPGHRFRGDPRTAWRLARIARTESVDVIHTHGLVGSFYGRVAGRLAKKPVVTTVHSVARESIHDWCRLRFLQWCILKQDRWLSNWSKHLIVLNSELHDIEIGLGVPEKKLSIIPNTIDLSRFDMDDMTHVDGTQAGDARTALRNQLKIPADAVVFGLIGRLAPAKNPHAFIDLAEQLSAKRPEAHFILVGDGPLRAEIEELINRKNLASRIHMVGWQDNIIDWYSAIDVLALTSQTEADPGVVHEAMAMRKPVIAFPVGTVSQIVENGTSGFLVNGMDEMVAAAEKLAANASLTKQMGVSARKRLLEHIKQQNVIGRLISVYESVQDDANNR